MQTFEASMVELDDSALDTIFNTAEDTVDEDIQMDGEKEIPKQEVDIAKEEELVMADQTTDDDEEEKPKEDAAKSEGKGKKEPKQPETPQAQTGRPEVLKNIVDFYVEKGYWTDFEGREELEVTDEIFQEILIHQDQERVTSLFEELLDQTGEYGKAIISYIREGGNPDEIIDLFKEQKQIDAQNPQTPEDKREFIADYYRNVFKWKPEKINQYLKSVIANDTLDAEIEDVKEGYKDHYAKELESIREEQEEAKQRAAREAQEFTARFQQELKNKNISAKEQAAINRALFERSVKTEDGQKISQFQQKFMEMRGNLSEYIDFVRYVMDKESYLKSLTQDVETKTQKKTWNFIKANAATKNSTGSSYTTTDRGDASKNKQIFFKS